MTLPAALLRLPIAHRALHDIADGRPENSLAAIRAAVAAGYAIEIDVQRSSDGQAMVFHDYDLKRLTGTPGPIQQRSAKELSNLKLLGGEEGTPTLRTVLSIIDGHVPLVIEIKDQDGAMGPNVGQLEQAVAEALTGYDGDVAVMSFNPHTVAAFAKVAPDIPRGLVARHFDEENSPTLPPATRLRLRGAPDFDTVDAQFLSYDAKYLTNAAVQGLKARGVPVICWTVRSADDEKDARKTADNITFEGYLPAIP